MTIDKDYLDKYITPKKEIGDIKMITGMYFYAYKQTITSAPISNAINGKPSNPKVVAVVLDYYWRK